MTLKNLSVTKFGRRFACLVVLAATLGSMGQSAAEEFDHLPWDLRAHFLFTSRDLVIRYAGDNTRWDITHSELGPLTKGTGFSIRLGDGTEIGVADFNKGKSSRNPGTSPQGDGVHYYTDMATPAGIAVHHSFFINKTYPFYGLTVDVKNGTEAPIEIARIETIQFQPGSFSALSDQTKAIERELTVRGIWPLFNSDAPPLSVMLNDPANNITIAMGLLPRGMARTTPRFFESGDGWQGGVVSEFDPPITLQPGESVSSDPVWLSLGTPNPNDVETLFVWTHSEEERPYGLTNLPDAWVTAPRFEPASALRNAMEGWLPLGIEHVLIPEGWEGRPGSLEGATPGYPNDMSRAADAIRRDGGIPGLTIDPLMGDGGNTEWSGLTDDGITWIDVSHPKGRQMALDRMRKVVSWDFAFFVVPKSTIPDAVLRHFNMTREQADTLALDVMTEAAGSKPVLPAPSATIGANEQLWNLAVSGSQRMKEYQLTIGPIRLDTEGRQDFTPAVIESIKQFGGPIEVVGSPSGGARRALDGVFPRRGKAGAPAWAGN